MKTAKRKTHRFVILVVSWNGDSTTVKHIGTVDTVRTLCGQLYVRHNPRYMEVSSLTTHKVMRYSF